MRPHVTDDPTEAEVKALLDALSVIFTGLSGGGVGLRVVWSDTIPVEIMAEAKRKSASFILQQSEKEFLLGYRGDQFLKTEPVFVPPPADRMDHYCFPGPKVNFKSPLKIALS